MRQGVIIVLLLAVLFTGVGLPTPLLAARGSQSSPKILNLYLDWYIKDADLPLLSRWDIVVFDMDMAWKFPDRIRTIRQANPNIKILAYISAGELAVARGQGDPASPGAKLAGRTSEELFMHKANGSRLSWWPGAQLMNATDVGPTASGKRWGDVLPDFVRDEMMSTGLWDGVFLDAAYSELQWQFGTDIDPDGDRKANATANTNAAWRTGMTRLLKNMRSAVGPNRLIMTNSSDAYAAQVNGVLFENFPRYGWAGPQAQFQDALAKNVKPAITAFNTNTDDQEKPADYRLMRLGLASALLGDGYYSFDAGPSNHARTWWYDEYDAALGKPIRAARKLVGSGAGISPGVWIREYERGLAVVNSENISRRITLPASYEKIRGTQDSRLNDGQLIRTLDIGPQDGVILLGQSNAGEVKNASFTNGDFLRVYGADGQQKRSAFFSQRDEIQSGAQTIVTDIDQNGTEWTVSAFQGQVTLKSPGGKKTSFYPFGTTYKGLLTLAVANTNRDVSLEIVVGRDKAKPSDVRIFTRDGKELARWIAYNANFGGGARVAVGDLDGDGLREVVTAAGPGGGPHVRIFKTDGRVWGGSFFAFPQNERGGTSVAVGDIDGDGKAEIIVGSGEGALPRVRIFDFRGTLKRELNLGSTPVLRGLHVTATDMDSDGKADILVGGLPTF